ncbi:hypothetical protein EJD97_013435 [Solanum chilense]|uniref:Uncharacterized protein n=1 Tax=Solanum chilense TaxID=4083 RepID=A0A6N2C9M5_SOLCI|nr:hypothetical protein EJD97_013435 [Solanum chilense]
MQELHFEVLMVRAIFCTLNKRHNSAMVLILLMHSETEVIFVDQKLLEISQGALALLAGKKHNLPRLADLSN